MKTVTITEVLDDLRAADEITRRFERRYWLSSADFYQLFSGGLLDDGEHADDFAIWAAYHEIKLDRENDLQCLSQERVRQSARLVLRERKADEAYQDKMAEAILRGIKPGALPQKNYRQ